MMCQRWSLRTLPGDLSVISKNILGKLLLARTLCAHLVHLLMGFYLREFGVQTTVIAAPVRWGGLLPAVLVPGPAGTHVAQTLRFSRFIA